MPVRSMTLGGPVLGVHGKQCLCVEPQVGGGVGRLGSELLACVGVHGGAVGLARWDAEEWQQQEGFIMPARSRTHGAGLVKQDSWSRTRGTELVEQDSRSRTCGAGLMEQDLWRRTPGLGGGVSSALKAIPQWEEALVLSWVHSTVRWCEGGLRWASEPLWPRQQLGRSPGCWAGLVWFGDW